MSNLLSGVLRKARPLFAAAGTAGLLATTACSTDVQRFGQVGGGSSSQFTPTTVATAPLEPVQTGPASPQPVSTGSANSRYAAYRAEPPASAGSVRVQSGDTLYSIARANGVTVEKLADANGIAYPYNVRIGQSLSLPGAPRTVAATTPSRPARSGDGAHVVEPGETLFAVSRRYGVNVRDLAAANGLTLQSGLRIGQRLTIPDGSTPATARTAVGGPLADEKEAAPAPQPVRVAKAASQPPRETVAKSNSSMQTAALPAPPTRATSQFRWPVRGRLISRFGPQSNGSRNDGINISVPAGTSVKAAENGVVAYAGNELKGYGNLVLIRHSDDWVTAYAHNGEILVQRGDTVQRGQIIAKAGMSGSVDKPQVHFEVRKGAKAVDPLPYLEGA